LKGEVFLARSLGLWLKFKIQENIYAMDCAYVKYIGVVPKEGLTKVANSSDYVRGIYKNEGEVITLISLRSIFELESFENETHEFLDMLEQRKKEHIAWGEELERCIKEGRRFNLETDPHKCKFGMWYYNYKSSKSSINFQLKKIEEPHDNLHYLAQDVNSIIALKDKDEKVKKRLDKIVKTLIEDYIPDIVDLLDATGRVYLDVKKEMLVQVNDKDLSVAFSVDEIVGIEALEIIQNSSSDAKAKIKEFSEYVDGIARDKNDSIIMLLDIPALLMLAANVNN